MPFSDIYVFRLGASVGLSSACSGFAFQPPPPAVLPTSLFGQGISFRFVVTPQVWSIGGVGPFDGRDGDPFIGEFPDPFPNGREVALSKEIDATRVRFSIIQPAPGGGAGLDYARLGSVWAAFGGVRQQQHCVTGIPTSVEDLTALAGGTYARRGVLATAHVRSGATTRVYLLDRSVVTVAATLPAGQVTVSLRLIGVPEDGVGGTLDMGSFAASAPVNAATGNFIANFTSADRTVTGTISGRFFGPQAAEIGAAFGGTVAAAGGVPEFSFSGAAFGAR